MNVLQIAINALFLTGAAIGSLAQCFVADWVGRKKAFAVAAICCLIGAVLSVAAVNVAMLICVRIIQGFGLGMLICLVPLYLTEIAQPAFRGLLSGLTVMSFGMGYFV